MTLAIDILIRDTLVDALALLKNRADLVDQVFAGASQTTCDSVREYLSETPIDVRLGWTQAATRMPVIAVTLPSEQEATQYVGSEPGPDYDTDTGEWIPSSWVDEDIGAFSESEVAQFSGSVDAAIYALNATEASWLAAMIKWAMLRFRRRLEDAGLFDQRITTTDFMPASDYPQPDPAYTRVVKVQYSTLAHYTIDNFAPDSTETAHSVRVVNAGDA